MTTGAGAGSDPERRFRPRFFMDYRAFGDEFGPELERISAGRIPSSPAGAVAELGSEDAHHARNVLRARTADQCEVVLEPYRLVFAATLDVARASVRVRLEGVLERAPRESKVMLVQALPHLKQVDVIVEKGTEVGVDEFILVRADGSPPAGVERVQKRLERWGRVARGAAKQSRQFSVPRVETMNSVPEVLAWLEDAYATPIVCDPRGDPELVAEAAGAHGRTDPASRSFALLVGPEGGWSDGEIALFRERALPFFSFGYRILRTETAGPVAAALLRFTLSHR